MRVLVAVASRHGATTGIARTIAGTLRERGLTVDLLDADQVEFVGRYDAAVIGSGVYAGNWLPAARRLVARHGDRLRTMPVWLFSSGPLGADEPKPTGNPPGVAPIQVAVGAHEHVVFAGRLDIDALNLAERLVARLVHAPAGDFRNWPTVRDWAGSVADTLAAHHATITSPVAIPAHA